MEADNYFFLDKTIANSSNRCFAGIAASSNPASGKDVFLFRMLCAV
jgi:hypothetical protein